MDNNTTLEINLNEEYKIKIENGNDFNKSIFKDVYESALKNVIEIVKQSDENKNSKYDDFNNIIAFTGERGKGKSSSMISFLDALINKGNDIHKDFFKSEDYQYLNNKSFVTIDIIDPSLFSEKESLFEIILAKMFQKFQLALKENNSNILQDDKRELIQHFQNVFENLQTINSDPKDLYKKESIEALSKLATSSNLRESFKRLVDCFLNKFEKNKNYIVFAIDDFDLNISGAYEMLEDIRKFLIQKNIILLIACKIEQLKDVIEIYYSEKKLINDLDIKSNKYLDKLFPFKRRLILPEVQKIKNLNLVIIDNKEEKLKIKSSDLSEAFGQLIFDNFNIYISKSVTYNYVYPDTIRESQNFFNLINDSNDFSNFKRYILQEIDKKNIYTDFFKKLDELDCVYLNLTIIRFIVSSYKMSDLRVLSSSRIPERISIGDVLHGINSLEKRLSFDDYEILQFVEYLKLYYFLRIKEEQNLNPITFENIGKYGFVFADSKILSEDSGNKSRDFVEFLELPDISSLNNSEKFILSQFMFTLGDGKTSYRNDIDKNNLILNFKKGTLSPFSIFHNLYNFDFLLHAFNFQADDFINKNLLWFKNSIFIEQLFNPFFALNFFEELSKFRKQNVKEELPKNYFDTFVLLFIYGSINSIKNKTLVENFINYPLVRALIITFLKRNKTNYTSVSRINNEFGFSIGSLYDFDILSDNFINIINTIYEKSSDIKEESSKDDLILIKLKTLLRRIKDRPHYKIQTLSTIINEIKEIDDFNSVIYELSSFKEGINSVDNEKVKISKAELEKYLIGKING